MEPLIKCEHVDLGYEKSGCGYKCKYGSLPWGLSVYRR